MGIKDFIKRVWEENQKGYAEMERQKCAAQGVACVVCGMIIKEAELIKERICFLCATRLRDETLDVNKRFNALLQSVQEKKSWADALGDVEGALECLNQMEPFIRAGFIELSHPINDIRETFV